MKREDLLYICGGRDWYCNDNLIHFSGNAFGNEISFDFTGYTEEELLSSLVPIIERIINEIDRLDKDARSIIKGKHKDEDVDVLELTNIIFDKSGCYDIFALGYHVGETNAGELYLLIKFDENLKADKDIVYEIY